MLQIHAYILSTLAMKPTGPVSPCNDYRIGQSSGVEEDVYRGDRQSEPTGWAFSENEGEDRPVSPLSESTVLDTAAEDQVPPVQGQTDSPAARIRRPLIDQQEADGVAPLETSQGRSDAATRFTQEPRRSVSLHTALRRVPARKPVPSHSKLERESPKEVAIRGWKPFYLQKIIIVLFMATFCALFAAIQAISGISRKYQGLATSYPGLHYLWTYGPTAILTLVLAFWSRVEFQSKMLAPWYRMARGPAPAIQTLLLDYLSVLQPVAIVKALHNSDWAVAASTTCSLLLRATIIVSTALISLSLTRVQDQPIAVLLQSSFVDDAAPVNEIQIIGTMSYYNMEGLINGSFKYPDGTSAHVTFQQFTANISDTTEIHITVDGFVPAVECQPASLEQSAIQFWGLEESSINVTLASDDCQSRFTVHLADDLPTSQIVYFGRFGGINCNGSLNPDDARLVLLAASLRPMDPQASYNGTITQSTVLICKPTYTISKVDVTKNRTDLIDVSVAAGATNRTIRGVHPIDLALAYLSSFESALSTEMAGNVTVFDTAPDSNATLDLDTYVNQIFAFRRIYAPDVAAILNYALLAATFAEYYGQYSVFLAHQVLTQKTSTMSTGYAMVYLDRLVASSTVGYVMTGLLATCVVLGIVILLTGFKGQAVARNPGSFIGTTVLLAQSQELLESLRGLGGAKKGMIRQQLQRVRFRSGLGLEGCFAVSSEPEPPRGALPAPALPLEPFHEPFVLRWVWRLVVYVLVLAVIIALEVVLRVSERNGGLQDVPDDTYSHYYWTAVPALVMSLFAMYFSAVDFEIRSLSPYKSLKHGASFDKCIGLSLLDRSVPPILWTEFRTKQFAALATTLGLLISSLLTIFTGSLFFTVSLSTSSPVQLQTVTSFVPQIADTDANVAFGEDYGQLASTLILDSNGTYPAFTYEDLVFPEYSILDEPIDGTPPEAVTAEDTVTISVPALRSRMSCRRYDSSQMQVAVQSVLVGGIGVHGEEQSVLAVDIQGEWCGDQGVPSAVTHNAQVALPDSSSDFNFAKAGWCYANGQNGLKCCSNWLYVWGHYSNTSSAQHTWSALACNESIEAVDVAATLLGPELQIDPSQPPVPNNASSRESTVSLDMRSGFEGWVDPYDTLVALPTHDNATLGHFFELLTTSRYAVPESSLVDPDQSLAVTDAILFQHGIIRAQALNRGYRVPADTTNATLRNPPVDLDQGNDAIVYNGTKGNALGRRRLVQDAVSTRVLEALLAATLLFSLFGWIFLGTAKLLPREPTSVANVAALLADGDLIRFLPRDAHRMGDEELRYALAGFQFRMDWWADNSDQVDGRGINDGERGGHSTGSPTQRFGVTAVRFH